MNKILIKMKVLKFIWLVSIIWTAIACDSNSESDIYPSADFVTSSNLETFEVTDAIDNNGRNKTSNTANKNILSISTFLNPPAENSCNTLPIISLNAPTNISSIGATFVLKMVNFGNNCKITEHGHIWILGTTNAFDLNTNGISKNTLSNAIYNNGIGISSPINLIPGSKYSVKAYAKNEFGTQYTESTTFETQAITGGTGGCNLATVITTGVSNCPTCPADHVQTLTATTANFSGTINLQNACPVIEYGHILVEGINHNLSLTTANIVRLNRTGAAASGTTFSSNFTGLKSKTTYSVKAYVTNEKGTFYTSKGVGTGGESYLFTTI